MDTRESRCGEQLLRLAQVARRLGVSVPYVKNLIRGGHLPGVEVAPTYAICVRESDLTEYEKYPYTGLRSRK